MVFSKSFGYAVRGLLYIASQQEEKRYIHAEELAIALKVPRHFMSKILKKLAARGVLHSVKGPFGGFAITEQTLQTKLIDLLDMIDGLDFFQTCMLQLGECNAENPCPLHVHVQSIKAKMQKVLTETNLVALMNGDNDMLVKSIITQKSNALNS